MDTPTRRAFDDPSRRIVTGVCPHDCPDTCSWQVAVDRDSGRAVDLRGHPEHPLTRGALCSKVDRYLERTYHPERLQTPLRRSGPKGQGRFEPITWDVALAEIGDRLGRIIERTPAAVLPYSYAGTMGLLQGEAMAQRLFHKVGASELARTICSKAGGVGHTYTTGAAIGMDPLDFAHASLVLIWGSNTLTSNPHLWRYALAARKRGAKIIVIDPVCTRTAKAADEWLPIRPGTDAALALGIMHIVFAEGLEDQSYLAQHTLGADQLRARVREFPPERVAAITGIDRDRIVALAREYATTRAPAIRINYGLQRHRGGGMAVRTLTCLPAIVGAFKVRGGGILLSTSGQFMFDRSQLLGEHLAAAPRPRCFNMSFLGDALSLDPAVRARALLRAEPNDPIPTPEDAGSPVHALIVYNANPVAVNPDQRAVRAGLAREDLLTVVLEHFQTDTADWADYVLPATTQLEHWDLLKPYGHLYLALNRPAIDPLHQALPNSEIFRRIAAALGHDDPEFAQSDRDILREFVNSQQHEVFEGITFDRLLREGFCRLNLPEPYLPFAEGGFLTPSGKCELYSQSMLDAGYDPVPDYTPPLVETSDGEGLTCLSPPAHSFLNSSFVNLERLRKRERTPVVKLHPDDANARGIHEGQRVRLHNRVGEVEVTATIGEDVRPGVVVAPGVWWAKYSPDGCNINQVVPQDQTDMGGGAIFYDVRVEVTPVVVSTE